jgi:PIN domain nuclease of toxin-antitoxin system
VSTLLLDTHVVLWLVADPGRVGPTAMAAVADVDNEVVVSVASVWEASIKAALGKLRAPAELWSEVERSGITLIPIERDDAIDAAALPAHHRDPFERMLIAQAQRRSAILVTVDRWADAYDVRTLAAGN